MKLIITLALCAGLLITTAAPVAADNVMNTDDPKVTLGVEQLLGKKRYLDMVRGKRVGLITNPTGVDSKWTSTVDLLFASKDFKLVALYGPEHGVRGNAYAGEHVTTETDTRTGLPVYSLYGKTRRPPAEYLDGIDVMLYDIQDIGSRSYTYIYTMAYAMEECGKRKIPFIVLDRPNPAGGHIVDGNILDPKAYSTFVGLYAIPYQYGMTPGETAAMFNEQFNANTCDLSIVPMRGYKRDMMQWDTGLPFVPTSNHIPHPVHATYYNLTGIIGELPDISIGVGYTLPFETIAAPWISDPESFAAEIRTHNLPGILVRPITYKPRYAAFKDETCNGVHLTITNFDTVRAFSAQIHLMEVIQKLYPSRGLFTDAKAKTSLFDEVLGTDTIRQRILLGEKAVDILKDAEPDVKTFMKLRKKYLIYK